MTTITLPGASNAGTDVHAGITFENGTAEVKTLGTNARKYFDSIGALVTETADPLAKLRHGDTLLADLTVPQLRDLAQTEGIDVPAKATKPEILGLFLDAFTQED